MSDDLNGTTTIKNKSQLGIEVCVVEQGAIVDKLGELVPDESMNVLKPPGTTLSFYSSDSSETYDIYKTTAEPGEEPTVYLVYPVLKPVDELGPAWHSVPNFESALHGYDIQYMDPFVIDGPEGQKALIYETLASNGRDYDITDGNLYFKRGFSYRGLNVGWGSSQTQVHTSEQSFHDTATAAVGGGIDGACSLSTSYKNMTSVATGERSMYTTSFQRANTYSISVILDEAKLHEDFVNAVKELPYDASITDSTTYTQLSDDMKNQLTTFLQKFGTHMSTEMTFGGYYAYVNSLNEEDKDTTTQKGVNMEANASLNIDGVPVSGDGAGGYENIDSSSSMISASVTKYFYRGGNGGIDSWGVDDISDSQAMTVSVQRIHEVLKPDYFPTNVVPSGELKTKNVALGLAITDYIGSPEDPSLLDMKPKIFKIEYKCIKLTNANNHNHTICGKVKMIPSAKLNEHKLDGNLESPYLVFDREEKHAHDIYTNGSFGPDDGIVTVSQFGVPFSAIGDPDLYVTLTADLYETDPGTSGPEKYNTSDVKVKLGGTTQADYWVDLIFGPVSHEVSGNASKSKDGRVHACFETSWVDPY